MAIIYNTWINKVDMAVEFIHGLCARPEFGEMFGGWFLKHEGNNLLVDCGVGTGATDLVARLKKKLGPEPLDYVLLTHIHLDHAGGLGKIIETWPEVKVVAHKKGLRHLMDPEKLWAGTIGVMGSDVAEVYARPAPVAEQHLIPHTESVLKGIKIFETPGHASHHLSFRVGEVVFVGEAAGCPLVWEGKSYSRPATPPSYFPQVTQNSIKSLLELPDGQAYCGHTHEALPLHRTLKQCLAQLQHWDDIFQRPESTLKTGESSEEYQERLLQVMLKEDTNLVYLKYFSGTDLWKEMYFLKNSLHGFIEHYAPQI